MWLELVLATGLKELVFVDGYKFQGNDEYVVSENWRNINIEWFIVIQ